MAGRPRFCAVTAVTAPYSVFPNRPTFWPVDTTPNRLLYGDNIRIMEQMKLQSVDLIYLDPPFNSSQTYNLMYRTMTGRPVPEQEEAFFDTWQMTADQWAMLEEMPILVQKYDVETTYGELWRRWLYALKDTQPELLSYLLYMLRRLLQMSLILKPTGSLYVHCDPTASHYLKVLLDGLFGHQNFRNEIVWKRTFAHGGAERWGDVHDSILFYTKSDKYTWNRVLQKHGKGYVEDKYKKQDARGRYTEIVMTGPGTTKGASGQPWRGYDPTSVGRHWAVPQRALQVLRDEGLTIPSGLHEQLDLLFSHGYIYIPQKKSGPGVPRFKHHLQTKGQPIQDVITDIPPLNSQAKDRLGYQTQKPTPLLARIIEASSKPGDVVFDPFCGCGTTIYAAHETGRQWLGCDITVLAIDLVTQTLYKRYGLVENKDFHVTGIPVSVSGAEMLFEEDPQEFQRWAIQRVNGLPMTTKGQDRGIDGRLYYEAKPGMRAMVLQVKGGQNVSSRDVRDLRGVLQRENENVDLAGLISLKEPTKEMVREARSAGVFSYEGVDYPRIQMLTIREILEEKRDFKTPTKIKSRASTGQVKLPI